MAISMPSFIRQLPETLVNQIAAGEVIENPAAAIKELVENSIDAGATKIEITVSQAGKSLIIIDDNGVGMSQDDLKACLQRHATSKLLDDDLLDIHSLGFRGEALPSIASVGRMVIHSRAKESQEGWSVTCHAGTVVDMAPSSHRQGTRIEVRDLFYATPARLKFLKSDIAEMMAIKDNLNRLAMAYPDIEMKCTHDDKKVFHYTPQTHLERISAILGREFESSSMAIDFERDEVRLRGFASLPTLNKGNAKYQYLFVNGRPVKDRLLLGVLRGAYADVLAGNRYPMVALFLDLPSHDVDVNVHPAKSEVRFKRPADIRNMLFHAIQNAIREQSNVSAALLPSQMNRFKPVTDPVPVQATLGTYGGRQSSQAVNHYTAQSYSQSQDWVNNEFAPQGRASEPDAQPYVMQGRAETQSDDTPENAFPLGAALAQFHENYIVSQTKDGIVIVDQHAAHERLVYERMKQAIQENGIKRQILLVPEVVTLTQDTVNLLLAQNDILEQSGLVIESFGDDAVIVREVPAILGQKLDIQSLIKNLADEVDDDGTVSGVEQKINYVLATLSCHGSVRSGRRLNQAEMNELLRQMEQTPLSGQCNHGRPTMVSLSLDDVERLFKRQ